MIKDEVVVINHKNEIVWQNDSMHGLMEWYIDYMMDDNLTPLELGNHVFISRRNNNTELKTGFDIALMMKTEILIAQYFEKIKNASNN